ncbi:sulfite exporter TauE/SafE family protein [Desulfocurvus sp. DL9XJH121]
MFDLGIPPLDCLLAFLIVVAGAFGNGLAGFGLALLIGPFLFMIDPAFFPGPIILLVGVVTALIIVRERNAIGVLNVKRSLGGYVLGTGLAALLVARLPQRETALLFGVLIVLGVALSLLGLRVRPTRKVLFSAGLMGGFMGTLSGVNMPPLALALQDRPGPELRGTLSCVGLISVVMSVAALMAVGRLGLREVQLAAFLAPGVALGYVLSFRVSPLFDRRCTRPAVFLLSTISAVVMIARHL